MPTLYCKWQWHGTSNKEDKSLHDLQHVYLELLETQRKLLSDMNRRAEFDEEVIRKYLSLMDIEEFKVRQKLVQHASPVRLRIVDDGLR